MIFIDGKPMPADGKTLLNSAMFIARNLRPDSKILWIDYEGTDFVPTYDNLMEYAKLVLGSRFKGVEKVTPPPSHPAIREAVAEVCGKRLVAHG